VLEDSSGKILIADHQFLTAHGLRSLLQQKTAMQVLSIHSTENEEIFGQIRVERPTLLILDYLHFEDGESFIFEIQNAFPDLEILGITSDTNHERIRRLINKGVKGLLTKFCQAEEILTAVNALLAHNRFYCNRVLDVLVHKEVSPTDKGVGMLSQREKEVLQLIAEGFSTNEIADKLAISIHTVNSHRKNMLKKLELKSPIQLVTFALENGLVQSKVQ
jgi:DNA-binding NarL/FixJ family response regulator